MATPVGQTSPSGDAVASRRPIHQTVWGLLGAAAAAWFAIWLLVFPQFVPDYFAWNVHPRYAQAFIGAGYVFRTFFFLSAAREGNWIRLRWMIAGNLVFTGCLLFATYWHADEFRWNPFQTPLAHIWIVLYVFEPLTMLYLVPRGIFGLIAPHTGGPVLTAFKGVLIAISGVLYINGLLILINPEFAAHRWAWELNPLDAQIVSAWFLGWATWCATMAFARDWDEIRTAVRLFVLNGVALLITAVVFSDQLLPDRDTPHSYVFALAVMTIVMAVFHLLQERRRPAAA